MMGLLVILLFTLLQALMGMGLMGFFNIRLKPAMHASLAILCGVMIYSCIPFLLQLAFIPITGLNVFVALGAACLLLNIRYRRTLEEIKRLRGEVDLRIGIYELPYLIVFVIIVVASVWRCYYYPPSPRDLTSGAEVIATYAVQEKTMINSVFTVNLETTNNQYKPPFVTSLQIIYKYAGFPFAQVWLSTVFIAFLVFLYQALCQRVHPLLAGLLTLVGLAVPEMYAYTFMALFDYSNAVYFFLGVYFLIEYFKQGRVNYLSFAGLLMGFATYIRSETLILVLFMAAPLLVYLVKNRHGWKDWIGVAFRWGTPALLFYLVSITIYNNYYLPAKYDVGGLLNSDLLNLMPLWQRIKAVNGELIFSKFGIDLYAYSFFFFFLVLLIDLFYNVRLNHESRNWLLAVIIIYLGMPVLGYLLPLLDVSNSTKRGLFKIFPLMLLYMGSTGWMIQLSQKIRQWENRASA
ncbi:hypothetical protein [Paraflavitalea sp. CAU 1676]|uniref:hypothetical protein n=1 Tax=Paraflavitalea sp. CAU 1676 TaxID=3032598 RepID=UPI0023DB3EF4|nr:hypothetical protein [Paraflavitalea sp. CAU 1676]MDF2190155.1 hypothetical protein [Paraflavitalea sp. CAU 1676]